VRTQVSPGPIPNLFIVGAPKCGTTSLYEYLRQHPQIFFPFDDDGYSRIKEPNHFCPELEILEKDAITDRGEYLNLYRGSEDALWRGDASTNHLFSERAAGNIKHFCPDARILVMLRPPVDWMRSYHNELLRHQHEDIGDFYAAVAASEDRRNGLRLPPGTSVPKCLDYVGMSHFASQVERYYRVFGRDAVKVVLLEDMVAAPEETYREILLFLGVESAFSPEFRIHNETPRHGRLERLVTFVYKRLGVKHVVQLFLPYAARRKFLSFIRRKDLANAASDPRYDLLQEQCAPDVERLSTLIERDLSHWQPRPRQ
jgi:Sulfotransferase family